MRGLCSKLVYELLLQNLKLIQSSKQGYKSWICFQGSQNKVVYKKGTCLFYGDKFLTYRKILNVISLLPGGCLFTVEYGAVWCGGERTHRVAIVVDCLIQKYLLLYWAFLYTVSSHRRSISFFPLTSGLAVGLALDSRR